MILLCAIWRVIDKLVYAMIALTIGVGIFTAIGHTVAWIFDIPSDGAMILTLVVFVALLLVTIFGGMFCEAVSQQYRICKREAREKENESVRTNQN